MRLIFDKGEFKLIGDHILCLFVPSRIPALPDTYGDIQPGGLEDWPRSSVDLLVEEGRRRLDAVNAEFAAIQTRCQYVLATSLAAAGALVGLLDHIVDGPVAFLAWAVGMGALVVALLVAFASFAATARLGSVDPVLFSREDGRDELEVARSLARAYAKAVRRSTTAVHARFTLYRDAIWFLVAGIALSMLAWILGAPGV